MKEKNFVSAVVYVHNSEEILKEFLPFIYSVLTGSFERFEIICVNDASTDESQKVIKDFSKTTGDSILTIVNMGFYQGIELSMNAGVDLAIGDFVFEFDTIYFNYNAQFVTDVYQKALEGYDIVSAAPAKAQHFTSKLFYSVYNKNKDENGETSLHQEVFHIISRRAINRTDSINKVIGYRKAVYANCGLKVASIFYNDIDLRTSHDKQEKSNRMTLAIDTLILYTNVVQKISSIISIFFLSSTIAIGLYSWCVYFWGRRPVEGWTPLMLFLSLGFAGIFILFTIVLKYMSVILKLIFKKQHYLTESINKITNC